MEIALANLNKLRISLQALRRIIIGIASASLAGLLVSERLRFAYFDQFGSGIVLTIVISQVVLFFVFSFPKNYSHYWGALAVIFVAVSVVCCSRLSMSLLSQNTSSNFWLWSSGLFFMALIACNCVCLSACPIGIHQESNAGQTDPAETVNEQK